MSCIASFTHRKEETQVTATVTEHSRTAKVIVFKKKRRKQYQRKRGVMCVMVLVMHACDGGMATACIILCVLYSRNFSWISFFK